MATIAMLGGLGASGPYFETPSAASGIVIDSIGRAKTVEELVIIKNGLVASGVTPTEAQVLSILIDNKIEDLQTPFYGKAGFWYTLGIAGAVWILRKPILNFLGFKGKGGKGLGAWDRKAFNPTGKLPGARPKAGYTQEFNPYAREDAAIKSLDEYFKQKRAVARKARKMARKAAKKQGLGGVSDWRRSSDDSYSLRRGNLYAAAEPSGSGWKWFVIDESRMTKRVIAKGRASNLVEASMRAEKKMGK